MKVYKFGGAFVQNIKNVRYILKDLNQTEYYSTIIVVSAINKSSNSLEDIIQTYLQKKEFYKKILDSIGEIHYEKVKKIFTYFKDVPKGIKNICKNLGYLLFNNKSDNFNYLYDQIISVGEIFLSIILSFYLKYSKINNTWIEIRNYLKTHYNYKHGALDCKLIYEHLENCNIFKTYVTHGFSDSNSNYFTVYLGSESSDYPTTIIIYYLSSKVVIIRNDVKEVINGNFNYVENSQVLEYLSYKETIDISFISKCILQLKIILLYKSAISWLILSYLKSENQVIGIFKGAKRDPNVSCFIQKLNVHLPVISPVDFTYNPEDILYVICKQITELNIKIGMINIAYFLVLIIIKDKFNSINILLNILVSSFIVTLEENVRLLYCNK